MAGVQMLRNAQTFQAPYFSTQSGMNHSYDDINITLTFLLIMDNCLCFVLLSSVLRVKIIKL